MTESSPQSKHTTEASDAERYTRLLDEARGIHGVSLWQDAWRRLRRNRVAMGSLYYVIAISVLAVFVPLLPLQSPLDKDLRNRKDLPPNLAAISLGDRSELRFENNSLQAELNKFEASMAEMRRAIASSAAEQRADQHHEPAESGEQGEGLDGVLEHGSFERGSGGRVWEMNGDDGRTEIDGHAGSRRMPVQKSKISDSRFLRLRDR
ncbi:MAG TPA: hypothetical protein P5307_16210 [Pirellulaceae bacterium]|nr:hypothetical protein [Pirellulaceae bacterium]